MSNFHTCLDQQSKILTYLRPQNCLTYSVFGVFGPNLGSLGYTNLGSLGYTNLGSLGYFSFPVSNFFQRSFVLVSYQETGYKVDSN